MMTTDDVFARGQEGLPSWIAEVDGRRNALPVARWLGGTASSRADRQADAASIAMCSGPTLDLGCGPGRLTEALTSVGVSTLGVDSSPFAVQMTNARGGIAIERDIFSALPGEGLWSHVLLADGNIGIGGDPLALLRRARSLLRRGGSVVVEVEPSSAHGLHRRPVRWESEHEHSGWFDWASADARTMTALATEAGFVATRTLEASGRVFMELALRCSP